MIFGGLGCEVFGGPRAGVWPYGTPDQLICACPAAELLPEEQPYY